MSRYELAQVNIARLREPIDSPLLADFVAALERINALAESSPGFVWRFKEDELHDAAAMQPLGEEIVFNLSVWRDPQALKAFVYRSDHTSVMRRRREWFERMEIYMALWWVPCGHRPTSAEAISRLDHMRAHGPSAHAFTFRELFPAPDAPAQGPVDSLDTPCPAT